MGGAFASCVGSAGFHPVGRCWIATPPGAARDDVALWGGAWGRRFVGANLIGAAAFDDGRGLRRVCGLGGVSSGWTALDRHAAGGGSR